MLYYVVTNDSGEYAASALTCTLKMVEMGSHRTLVPNHMVQTQQSTIYFLSIIIIIIITELQMGCPPGGSVNALKNKSMQFLSSILQLQNIAKKINL
jgi:hypothetical protein